MQNKSNYNKHLKSFARELRNDSTMGEALLWNDLKGRRMFGYSFNRQFSMQVENKNIIVDFICRKLKLVIEVDGYSHSFKVNKDKERDVLLKKNGYHVLRVLEKDVKNDIDNVRREIELVVKSIEKR